MPSPGLFPLLHSANFPTQCLSFNPSVALLNTISTKGNELVSVVLFCLFQEQRRVIFFFLTIKQELRVFSPSLQLESLLLDAVDTCSADSAMQPGL